MIVSGYGRGQQNEILQAERLVSQALRGAVWLLSLIAYTIQGGIHPDMIMLAIGEEITFGRSFDEVITANGAMTCIFCCY